MVNERNPIDPFDPYRSGPSDDSLNRRSRDDDDDLRFDPDRDGPFLTAKVALFAVGAALVLGAIFYGLNNTGTHQASNTPPAQTAQSERASPQAPSGTRPNTPPGMTTGAAPAQPTMPPATAPTNMARPPAGDAPNKN